MPCVSIRLDRVSSLRRSPGWTMWSRSNFRRPRNSSYARENRTRSTESSRESSQTRSSRSAESRAPTTAWTPWSGISSGERMDLVESLARVLQVPCLRGVRPRAPRPANRARIRRHGATYREPVLRRPRCPVGLPHHDDPRERRLRSPVPLYLRPRPPTARGGIAHRFLVGVRRRQYSWGRAETQRDPLPEVHLERHDFGYAPLHLFDRCFRRHLGGRAHRLLDCHGRPLHPGIPTDGVQDEGVSSRLLHRQRGFGGAIRLRRLPQLDPVSFGVPDPAQPAVPGVPDFRVDVDSFFPPHREDAVEVLHTVVDHERGAAFAEIRGLRGEDRPDRVTSAPRRFPGSPGEERDQPVNLEPEVFAIPAGERLRIFRLEEDASDSRHADSAFSSGHTPGAPRPSIGLWVAARSAPLAWFWYHAGDGSVSFDMSPGRLHPFWSSSRIR